MNTLLDRIMPQPMREGEGAASGNGGNGGAPAAPWATPQGQQPGVWKIGEAGKEQPWWAAIPDEAARKHAEAKQWATPADAVMSSYQLTRLQTGDPNIVSIPGKDADAKAWDGFWAKLGRPETPDKYDFKFGEKDKPDDNMVKFGRSFFYKLGLSNERANAAIADWNTFVAEQNAAKIAADKQQNDREIAELETRWKTADELNANKQAGLRVVKSLKLSDDLIGRIENNIGTAAIVELLATIGKMAPEGKLIGGEGGGDPNVPENMNAEQATARANQLMGDADFQKKYTDAKHPEHADAVKLIERLFARGASVQIPLTGGAATR